ncbi:hypothetical protein HY641_02230 [Candidatus Woesearchaeota archaeon]|nr:hypothetical protein [Candidatus Woesearchaeota archaeon]
MVMFRHRLADKAIVWEPEMLTVVSKDVFSLEYLYVVLHEWLIEHGWCDRFDAKFRETYYEQRDFGGGPRELWIRWRMTRAPASRWMKDPLFTAELDFDMHALGVKPTEVVVKGRKLGADTGEMEVKCRIRLLYNKKYQGTNFLKNLIKYASKRMFKPRIDAHQKELYNELTELQEALKTYFMIETYLDEPQLERFHLTRSQENL